jgi:hypothetical protein
MFYKLLWFWLTLMVTLATIAICDMAWREPTVIQVPSGPACHCPRPVATERLIEGNFDGTGQSQNSE